MKWLSTRDAGFEAAFRALIEDGRETTTRVDAAVTAPEHPVDQKAV